MLEWLQLLLHIGPLLANASSLAVKLTGSNVLQKVLTV
ncbi:hypothetical protein BH11VER1_BH11VER1_26110 [soil metagenome]